MARKKRTLICQRKKYHYKKRKITEENCQVKKGILQEHGYSAPQGLQTVVEMEKSDPQGGWNYQCSVPSQIIKQEKDECDAQVDGEHVNNVPEELEERVKCESQVNWYTLTTTELQTNEESTDTEFNHVQLSQPSVEIETKVTPLQILYDNLHGSDFLKMLYFLDFNDDAINIIEMYRSSPARTGVKLSVLIDTEFHARLFVHRRELSKTHPCWVGMPSEFSTVTLVEDLMRRISSFSVCFGNPDEEFHSIVPVDGSVKSGVTTGNNDIVAFREGDFCAILGDVSYSSCIRSVNCPLLVQNSRCKPCQRIRHKLRMRKSRETERAMNAKDKNYLNSTDSHKIMSRTELIAKLEQQRKKIKSLSSEVEKLKKTCNNGRV
ncbi:uncharacterized protein LOC134246847 [Saccostrea cucullata]|uniref:uncharacterized protein LOC134246847 n=1 Tax=Saccostrea cuccullata TaxID=36930 RepID=UPI002ED083A6